MNTQWRDRLPWLLRLARIEDELRMVRLGVEAWAEETRRLRRQLMTDANANAETLDDVLEVVRSTQGRADSIVALVHGLADRLEQDPAKLHEVISSLRNIDQELADAVDANSGPDEGTPEGEPATPVEPAPTEEPGTDTGMGQGAPVG